MVVDTEYEYCVMHSSFPDEPHRIPTETWDGERISGREWCERWIAEAIEDGFSAETFYVARRPVGEWEVV